MGASGTRKAAATRKHKAAALKAAATRKRRAGARKASQRRASVATPETRVARNAAHHLLSR